MAGRNHIPLSARNLRSDHHLADELTALRPHRRLTPTEVYLIEDRIAAQKREIQTLLLDNQRLATSHVALKQDFVAAQKDLRHLDATASTVKAERDAHVREVYDRSIKLEAEVLAADALPAELDRVRSEIKELRSNCEKLTGKLKETEDEIARTRPAVQEFSDLKTDIEAMQREIRKGRAAVEYEKKMHSTNLEISEVMEKHLIAMAREAEKLRSELANADNRAITAVLGAGAAVNPGAGAAVNPGPVYAIHQRTLDPGFGGNSLPDHNAVYAIHQRTLDPGFGGNSLPDHNAVQQGTFNASMNGVYGGPVIPQGHYDIQR